MVFILDVKYRFCFSCLGLPKDPIASQSPSTGDPVVQTDLSCSFGLTCSQRNLLPRITHMEQNKLYKGIFQIKEAHNYVLNDKTNEISALLGLLTIDNSIEMKIIYVLSRTVI